MSANVLPIVQELGSELIRHTQLEQVADPSFYAQLEEDDVQEACHRLFRDANTLAQYPAADVRPGASFELTRTMLAVSQKPDAISAEDANTNGSCFQSELRLMRTLGRIMRRTTTPDRAPSAILFDDEGQPFALQKADGYATAYAWRASHYPTQSGTLWVPDGAIFEPVYGGKQVRGSYPEDPRHQYRGAGLIALRSAVQPDTARLKRMSAAYLPAGVRQIALASAAYDVVTLASQYDRAMNMTSETVKQVIQSPLDKAIFV